MDFESQSYHIRMMHERMGQQGFHTPPMVVCDQGKRHGAACLARPFDNRTEKEAAFKEMMSLIVATGAQAAVFVMDAWMSSRSVSEVHTDITGKLVFSGPTPSEDPNRIEVLNIVYMERGAPAPLSYAYPYLRDKKANIYWIEAEFFGPPAPAEGLVADLLFRAFAIDPATVDMSVEETCRLLQKKGHSVGIWDDKQEEVRLDFQ